MKTNPIHPEFGEADLDRALQTTSDSILPSYGFAGNVMAAVLKEATAPPPLSFPWKRALPGLVAAVVSIGLLVSAVASLLRSAAVQAEGSAAATASWQRFASPMFLRNADAFWVAIAFAIPLLCLFLCRRLIRVR